jgi:hypothetical protein
VRERQPGPRRGVDEVAQRDAGLDGGLPPGHVDGDDAAQRGGADDDAGNAAAAARHVDRSRNPPYALVTVQPPDPAHRTTGGGALAPARWRCIAMATVMMARRRPCVGIVRLCFGPYVARVLACPAAWGCQVCHASCRALTYNAMHAVSIWIDRFLCYHLKSSYFRDDLTVLCFT